MFARPSGLHAISLTMGVCVTGCPVPSSQCESSQHGGHGPDAEQDSDDSCVDDQPHSALRVYHNPYAEVDWRTDRRLITQFHDHAHISTARIALYDAAGYDVMPLFHYVGIPETAGAWTEVHWPAEQWLPEGFIEGLVEIEQFFPGGEHAAEWHFTGPFLTSYIERWDPAKDPVKRGHHYQTNQELIDLITARGGYPVLAHPWTLLHNFTDLTGLHAVEVYSAFGELNYLTGVTEHQPNDLMMAVWDDALERDPQVFGLAVNDWHGPFCETEGCAAHPRAKDSGKVEILAPRATLDAIEAAFARGAMFAVKDYGLTKLAYPRVESIEVEGASIVILAQGDIRWISHGEEVGRGEQLRLDVLPLNARHLRAEISDAEGSVVFVQPFMLAPTGDIDGDGIVDRRDAILCEQVLAGLDTDPDHVAAATEGCD
ncbi:MAG: hypothetical protein R6X02_07940 [Enhygromyxa sp.]